MVGNNGFWDRPNKIQHNYSGALTTWWYRTNKDVKSAHLRFLYGKKTTDPNVNIFDLNTQLHSINIINRFFLLTCSEYDTLSISLPKIEDHILKLCKNIIIMQAAQNPYVKQANVMHICDFNLCLVLNKRWWVGDVFTWLHYICN